MSFIPFLDKAIMALAPGAQWTLVGDEYEGLEWRDTNIAKPTKEAILAESANQQEIARRNSHHVPRSYEYPKMNEFLDAYYWQQKGDSTKMAEWVAKVEAVKAKYPKPE